MKLGDGVEQGIHCVLLVAGLSPSGVLSAPALAEFHGVSTSYLLKHLQALSGAGILDAVPGPKGGYRLARPAGEITLLDIVLAIEGAEPAFRCAEIRRRGPGALKRSAYAAPCAINAAMLKAEQAYRAELRRITIADLNKVPNSPVGQALVARTCAFLGLRERHPST